MKKLLIVLVLVTVGYGSRAFNNFNEGLVRVFRETHPNAIDVRWMEYAESYAVYFSQDGIRTTSFFKKDGTFISSMRYYSEKRLPNYLRKTVRSEYPDKKLFGVTEVNSPESVIYFIKLEDAKNWITLRVDREGNMQVVEKFRKE